MNLLEELRNDAAAAELLKDWIGEGGTPVPVGQSWYRASVCAAGNSGEPCPLNVEPGWWDKVKSAIADTIRGQLSLKHRMKLFTPRDDSLHMCAGCGCCLRLKVHTPIKHIAEHTSPGQYAKLTDFCWMRKELDDFNRK